MATYLVLSAKSGPEKDPEAVFVRDDFSLLAAVFPVIWLLWHRVWLWAIVVLAVFLVSGASTGLLMAETLLGCSLLVVSLFVGFEGHRLHANRLERSGFSVQTVLNAPDLETAEALYFGDAPMVFSRASKKAPTIAAKARPGLGIFDSYGGV
jgi:Protein of unknown function (DUF2628)